jgi:hypothetical protein
MFCKLKSVSVARYYCGPVKVLAASRMKGRWRSEQNITLVAGLCLDVKSKSSVSIRGILAPVTQISRLKVLFRATQFCV